jgi:Tfp pilus assembly protein PilO
MPDKNTTNKSKKALKVPKTDISQNDDKSTRRFVFYMIVLIVLLVGAGGYLIYWLGKAYVLQSNKNKAQDKTIGLLEQKNQDLIELEPNYEKITAKGANGKSDADLINIAMPEDEGYKQLIAMIERMGQEAGVVIPGVNKSSATAAGVGPVPYSISISMTGTFAQVMDFIKKTENSSRVMDFTTLTFSGSSKGGPVSASASFTVYWQGPASIAPTEKELE